MAGRARRGAPKNKHYPKEKRLWGRGTPRVWRGTVVERVRPEPEQRGEVSTLDVVHGQSQRQRRGTEKVLRCSRERCQVSRS